MAVSYYLIWRTRAGAKVAEIDDYWALAYRRAVNEPGLLSFEMSADNSKIALLEEDAQIEVRRIDLAAGIDTTDFYGLYRKERRTFTDHNTITISCPGQMDLLADRVIAWYAGVTNRTSFSSLPAETIMKTLVSYNAGSAATAANGRLVDGQIMGLSVQTDAAAGNVINWSCAWKPLLPELQDIAKVAGGDFDLIKTGAQSWEFRFYPGQRGTNRSTGADKVTFSLAYGNMANPIYTYDRMSEATVAIVAGQGEAQARATSVRYGENFASINHREIFVDARQETTIAGLEAKGDRTLKDVQARATFEYDVVQVPSSRYGLHYFLGDLVAAQYQTISVIQQVKAVNIEFQKSGKEMISVEMRTPESL